MLARLRSLLDESTAAFWSNDELYRNLSDGQREIAAFAMKLFRDRGRKNLPAVLNPLMSTVNGNCANDTQGDIALTYYNVTGMWDIVQALYTPDVDGLDDYARCRIVENDIDFLRISQNLYTRGTVSSPLALIKTKHESTYSTEVFFKPDKTGSNAGAVIQYIKSPTDIAAGTEPILDDFTHNAIVQFAYSQALLRDQRTQEGLAEYQKFQDFLTRSIT